MKNIILLLLFSTMVMLCRAQADTSARLRFEETIFDFDTLYNGDLCEHSFRFTNTGTSPIIISAAYTNTGAAVCEYPKEPVKPGASGIIKYRYDSNRIGPFNKTFTLQGNFLPVYLRVKGIILPTTTENEK